MGVQSIGGIIASSTTEPLDLSARPGVGDVGAVPREKVVEAVNSGDGDVERICARLGWKPSGRDEMATERYRFIRRVEDRRVSQRGQPPGGRIRVTGGGLVEDKLRYVELERMAAVPPLAGDLLLRSADEIPCRSGRQVADDGRLDVGPRLQWDEASLAYPRGARWDG
jgi:hypothetical protein